MAVYREITCDQAVLTDAETAPAEIARVLRNARERSLHCLFTAMEIDNTTLGITSTPRLVHS